MEGSTLLCGVAQQPNLVEPSRFDRVLFAVPGKHRDVFERSFYATVLESELVTED